MNIEQYIHSIYNELTDRQKIQFKEELSTLLDFNVYGGHDLLEFLDMWEHIGYANSAKKWLMNQEMEDSQ
jgi:hypothetical protein